MTGAAVATVGAIVGETQATCIEMGKDFAGIWKGKDVAAIEERMNELHAATAFNSTIKSAFDMALYDLAAKAAGQPMVTPKPGQSVEFVEPWAEAPWWPALNWQTAREHAIISTQVE